jgi:uncharacterized protein (TIGR03435 family)
VIQQLGYFGATIFVTRTRMTVLACVVWALLSGNPPYVYGYTNTSDSQAAPNTQSVSDKAPEFEVATIKPVDPHGNHVMGVNVYPGGRIALTGLSLRTLICIALDVRYWQVSGGETWTEKTLYDLVAIPSENLQTKISTTQHTLFGIEDEHLRDMLQAVLLERFQLKYHHESTIGKVYLLKRGAKTLRLRPTLYETDGAGSIGFAGTWVLRNTTMSQLSKFASEYVFHCPVIDQTRLAESFDYQSELEEWETYEQDPTESFLRLLSTVGLRLVAGRGSIDKVMIDHAERPSPN